MPASPDDVVGHHVPPCQYATFDRMRIRPLGRWIGFGLLGLVLLFAVWIGVSAIVYSPEYVSRVLTMRESSQVDYLENFPTRRLHASDDPYRYQIRLDPEADARLEMALVTDDLDEFMDSTDTQALIVIEDATIVFERYANGAGRDSMLTSFSVAKSFDSALIGIAIDEDFISDVSDPVTDYLPELAAKDPRLSDVTVAHLLSMSSGLDYSEMRWALFNGDDPLTTYHPDQRQVSLDAATRIADEPGRYFRYNKYHPQLLGMVLERATGMSVTEFTQTRLWSRIGMEFDGQWTLDSEQSGFEKMEAGLNARAVDFAKLGSLFLNGGDWNGSRVVSEDWIRASVSPDPERDGADYYRDDFGQWIHQDGAGWYGYFWYGRARPGSEPDFFAEGDHGQFIYVSPSADTVIVRIGSEFEVKGSVWVDAFHDYCST